MLDQAAAFLLEVEKKGLFEAVEAGLFADVKRLRDGGRGLAGVFLKDEAYQNPFEDELRRRLGLKSRRG